MLSQTLPRAGGLRYSFCWRCVRPRSIAFSRSVTCPVTIEEILTLTKEMSEGQKRKEVDKAEKVDFDRVVDETVWLNEPERILKARIEAAEEELSWKRVEISEVRARSDVSGPPKEQKEV